MSAATDPALFDSFAADYDRFVSLQPGQGLAWLSGLGVRRLGMRDAWFELRFWHSKPWLEHLASDVYLSRQAFRELYDEVFPGARYDDLGFALGMSWTDRRGG